MDHAAGSLFYQAGDRGLCLRKQLADGSFVDPSPEEIALAHAVDVARATDWLRRKCQGLGQHFFEGDLPSVLTEAGRLRGALSDLQECLTDSDLRKRLGDAHAEAVNYAGEVAPSYVEAIYRAGERQYVTALSTNSIRTEAFRGV